MEITVNVTTDLKFAEAGNLIQEAARMAMRDTIVDAANKAIKGSPVKTGNNRRSLFYDFSGGTATQGASERGANDTWTGPEPGLVNPSKLEAVLYSTSGYGGFLEVGTSKMPARPYMKPAADQAIPKFPERLKKYLDKVAAQQSKAVSKEISSIKGLMGELGL